MISDTVNLSLEDVYRQAKKQREDELKNPCGFHLDWWDIPTTRYDDDSSNQRVCAALGYIAGKSLNVAKKILALHDHKGELNVLWLSEPDAYQMGIVNEAWETF